MAEFLVSSTLARMAFLIGIFAVVAMLVYLGMSLVSRRMATRSAIASLVGGTPEFQSEASPSSVKFQNRQTTWARLADAVERTGLNLTDTKSERLREKLVAAGFAHPAAPRVFTLLRLFLVIALPLAYVLIAYLGPEAPSFFKVYLVGSVLALMGLYLPNLFIQAKADRRKEAIVNGFPECLDLLLV